MSKTTKWLFLGSFLTSSLIAYVGAFSLSSFTERKLSLGENEAPSEINEVIAENPKPKSNTKNSKDTNNKAIKQYVDIIVRRSIFDSSKANIAPQKTEKDGDIVATDLNLTLLATIIATPAEYSIALIKEDNSGSSMSYGVGFQILGEATITKIEKDKVYFKRKNSDQIEFIEISEESKKPKKNTKTKSKSKNKDDNGIEKTGANQYVVDQKVLDEILENPEKLYTQVRVTPHKDTNGDIDGYRMTGIRRNSVFYKLGVKNGDIVHSVNGKPLNSMSSAMDAYNSLGNAKDFSFDITRRKSKRTFEYDVR
jgi:type II secretion system protein C